MPVLWKVTQTDKPGNAYFCVYFTFHTMSILGNEKWIRKCAHRSRGATLFMTAIQLECACDVKAVNFKQITWYYFAFCFAPDSLCLLMDPTATPSPPTWSCKTNTTLPHHTQQTIFVSNPEAHSVKRYEQEDTKIAASHINLLRGFTTNNDAFLWQLCIDSA